MVSKSKPLWHQMGWWWIWTDLGSKDDMILACSQTVDGKDGLDRKTSSTLWGSSLSCIRVYWGPFLWWAKWLDNGWNFFNEAMAGVQIVVEWASERLSKNLLSETAIKIWIWLQPVGTLCTTGTLLLHCHVWLEHGVKWQIVLGYVVPLLKPTSIMRKPCNFLMQRFPAMYEHVKKMAHESCGWRIEQWWHTKRCIIHVFILLY